LLIAGDKEGVFERTYLAEKGYDAIPLDNRGKEYICMILSKHLEELKRAGLDANTKATMDKNTLCSLFSIFETQSGTYMSAAEYRKTAADYIREKDKSFKPSQNRRAPLSEVMQKMLSTNPDVLNSGLAQLDIFAATGLCNMQEWCDMNWGTRNRFIDGVKMVHHTPEKVELSFEVRGDFPTQAFKTLGNSLPDMSIWCAAVSPERGNRNVALGGCGYLNDRRGDEPGGRFEITSYKNTEKLLALIRGEQHAHEEELAPPGMMMR
jgi:hypothetical protein